MDYTAALEDKSNTQAERVIYLEASVDVQSVLINTTEYVASVVATGTNKELSKIKAMMKQLAASFTAQVATVATLSTKMNGGSSGTKKTIEKKKARQGLHLCAHCKRKVYNIDRNCFGVGGK